MELKLELLEYQETAIKSVVNVFDGNDKNTFDNACTNGIRSNICTLSNKQLTDNIKTIIVENGIDENIAQLIDEQELTIEMETGTGKTLVYIKSIYEMFKHYGFTKFIILVPSVAIRQGVLSTLSTFEKQLKDIYGFTPKAFEYSSKRLNKVTNFVEEQHPQIMVMTLASFNSEDKILNQAKREDLFANIPFIEAIGRTNPIIIMDEPQEGMDTENSIKQIVKLNPLFKIRYSATHKVVKNKIYRLTPYDSYKQGLVKKIEVLTVTEKNDEATLKLELTETKNGKGPIQTKIKAWHQLANGKIEFKNSKWLKDGENLGKVTNNPSYLKYTISRINKSLRTGKWSVTFFNGVEIFEKQASGNVQSIWALQLEWLILRHFTKKQKLQEKGIKCLSLIFIDKVANYVSDDPIIKNLFIKKYKEIYPEFHDNKEPTAEHIEMIQGSYFAKTKKNEFTDNESSMRKNKDIFDAILKDKEGLLSYGDSISNKIEFIFSHSALGVGWDNPNIFNIATLSNSFSEIKKRQEIGRGLRICVNADGQRVYDKLNLPAGQAGVDVGERINQLTVIPNETYETFVTQYQEEIKEVYGTSNCGAGMTHTHKGKPQNEVRFKRNGDETINKAFKRFWKALAKKTDYTVGFDEDSLIKMIVNLFFNEKDFKNFLILDFFAGSGTTGHAITELNQKDGGNRKYILIQLPEQTDEKSEAYKAGYKKISDITIERNKRVIEKIIKEKKQAQPDLFKKEESEQEQLKGLGFKVFKLQKSNFPRVEFAPDPEKSEKENIELLKKYIKDKEAQLVSAFNKDELITEILIKNGFKLNYTLTKQEEFKKNEILLASDGDKETLICLDVIIDDATVEHFKTNTTQKLIVLERALDTTKKWNLKHAMGDKFNAF